MRYTGLIASCLALAAACSVARAAHLDARPYVADGKVMIGAAQLLGGQVLPTADHHRVFGAELGEDDPDQPFMTEDPGFLAEPGAFPEGAGELLGFMLLDGLKCWTGTGFGKVPAGESLQISRGSQSVTVADGPVNGYFFAIIGPDDGLDDCLALNHLGARVAMDRPPADLDFDRRVARSDFNALAACFTGPSLPWIDPCCRIADLDSDGDVDQSDFGLLQRCFSGESSAAPQRRP
ncbi:MAG: hypothetical protein KA354_20635 [Phycisphaerae bacterium]|nr:hypothetical protein [Phycisphaerae bacterium]